MMWGYSGAWNWLGFGDMLLSMMFLAALISLVIWAFVRWMPNQQASMTSTTRASAHEIVRQRYARGEIDTSTFHQMMHELTQSGTDTSP